MGPFEGGVRVVSFLSGGADLGQGGILPDAARGGYYNGLMSVVDIHALLVGVAGADIKSVTPGSGMSFDPPFSLVSSSFLSLFALNY